MPDCFYGCLWVYANHVLCPCLGGNTYFGRFLWDYLFHCSWKMGLSIIFYSCVRTRYLEIRCQKICHLSQSRFFSFLNWSNFRETILRFFLLLTRPHFLRTTNLFPRERRKNRRLLTPPCLSLSLPLSLTLSHSVLHPLRHFSPFFHLKMLLEDHWDQPHLSFILLIRGCGRKKL